tara:strand:+ start:331 stop:708 length:378 start_codon:yes stop_codon:yes gene_type:complete
MTKTFTLPKPFEQLASYCDRWCLPDMNARNEARISADMAEIREFYDDMVTVAPAVLEYLATKELGGLDDRDSNLLKLMLALAEVGPAVEWFGQPRVVDGYEESKFPQVLALDDLESQLHAPVKAS